MQDPIIQEMGVIANLGQPLSAPVGTSLLRNRLPTARVDRDLEDTLLKLPVPRPAEQAGQGLLQQFGPDLGVDVVHVLRTGLPEPARLDQIFRNDQFGCVAHHFVHELFRPGNPVCVSREI